MDAEISPENGQGEASMTGFIQQYMAKILQPFADHVDSLHDAVDVLREELTECETKRSANQDTLGHHLMLLDALRTDVSAVTSQANATQAGLGKTNEEKATLEVDHRCEKAFRAQLDERLQVAEGGIQTLQTGNKNADDAINGLSNRQTATESLLNDTIEPRIDNLHKNLMCTDSNLGATTQTLLQTKKILDDEKSGLEAFRKAVDDQNLKNVQRFQHFDASLSHLGASLTDTRTRLQGHADHLKTTNSVVRPLKDKIDQIEIDLKALTKKHGGTVDTLTYVHERQNGIHANLNKLLEQFGAAAQNSKRGANVVEEVDTLKRELHSQCILIQGLQNSVREHNEHLEQGNALDKEFQDVHSKIHEKIKRLADMIGTNIEAHERNNKEKEKARAGLRFQQVVQQVSITARQKQFKQKMDTHDKDMEATNAHLRKTNNDLDAQGQRVKWLESELAVQSDMVQKLKAGMDLMQEYWKGLSNGLRETHRSVDIHMAPTLPAIQKDRARNTQLDIRPPATPRTGTPRTSKLASATPYKGGSAG